uniref:DNA-directed RNA polymerase n=1 Tax=Pithovirus LCPAC103 TaxID=2506588 RepID=A0A481Z488_9VIRU|nr:MAG: DNA-directed RNA polymerase subunit alpha [Pithovirus LCPAC103]
MSSRRKLQANEISRLVASLSLVPTVLPLEQVKHAVLSTQQAILAAQLANAELYEQALPELLQYILKHYLTSQVAPGDTVGFRAAEALAGPATQIALNAFHYSGSNLNVTSGIGGLKEVLETKSSASQKFRMCTVHFLNKRLKLSDIVFHKQSQFMESRVYDYVLGHDILTAKDFWDSSARPTWLDAFRRLMAQPIPGLDEIDWVLQLNMDANRMYAMNVSMKDLADVVKLVDVDDMLYIWYSPMTITEPVMYIAADKERVMGAMRAKYGSLGDYLQLINFNLEIIPILKSFVFKGIEGITNIHPVEQSVLGIITSETRITTTSGGNVWLLQLSRLQIKVTGVTKQMLIDLIGQADTGLSVESITALLPEIDPEFLLLVRTAESETRKVSEILIGLRNEIEDSARELLKKGQPVASFALLDQNPLYNLFNYFYLETEGSNLHGILIRKDVDTGYTISSDVHEITRTLGTEAVRNYVLFILYRMIKSNGMDIDPRHLMLIGDVMVSTGKLVGMTMTGAAKLVPDHLTKTTIGEATKHLMQAAVFGTADPLRSIASALYLGKEPQIGTGLAKIKADEELSSKLVEELEEGRISSLPVDEFTTALDDLAVHQGQPLTKAQGRGITTENISDMPVGPATVALPAPGELARPSRSFSLSLQVDSSLQAGSVDSSLLREAAGSVILPDPGVCKLNRFRKQFIFPVKALTSNILKTAAIGVPDPGLNLLPADVIYSFKDFPRGLVREIYTALDQELLPGQIASKYQKPIMGPPIIEAIGALIETPVIATTGLDVFASIGLQTDLTEAWDI